MRFCPLALRLEARRQCLDILDLEILTGYSYWSIWGWWYGKDVPSWTATMDLAQALETETAALLSPTKDGASFHSTTKTMDCVSYTPHKAASRA